MCRCLQNQGALDAKYAFLGFSTLILMLNSKDGYEGEHIEVHV